MCHGHLFRICSEPADMLVARHRHGQEGELWNFFIANSTDAETCAWHERLVAAGRYRRAMRIAWTRRSGGSRLVGENPETCGRDCGAYTRAGAAGQVLRPPGAESMRFNKIPYEVRLGVLASYASMASAPRHRCVSTANGVVHTGSPRPAPASPSPLVQPRVRIATSGACTRASPSNASSA